MSQGHWTAPYFDCDGLVKKWLVTYVSPFFGWNSLRNRIEFKSVVSRSVQFVVYMSMFQGRRDRVHGDQEAGHLTVSRGLLHSQRFQENTQVR